VRGIAFGDAFLNLFQEQLFLIGKGEIKKVVPSKQLACTESFAISMPTTCWYFMFFYLPFLLVGILIYSSLDFHRFFIQALVASCSVKSWGREEGGEQHSERFFNQ
jgi:hypothetical protein